MLFAVYWCLLLMMLLLATAAADAVYWYLLLMMMMMMLLPMLPMMLLQVIAVNQDKLGKQVGGAQRSSLCTSSAARALWRMLGDFCLCACVLYSGALPHAR